MKRGLIPFVVIIIVLAIFFWGRRPEPVVSTSASLESLLVDDGRTADAFKRALLPDNVQFPRDLGPHEDYQTEWWYYTGNLETEDGRPFGYQFTIFRRSLLPEEDIVLPDDPSAWRSNQVYLAHFTISDIESGEFHAAERFSRAAEGLAGARAEPYHVWLENWSVEEVGAGQVRLQAETDEVALDLTLRQTLPPILHGEGGLSQKGPEPGNASYYYSQVQQESTGTVTVAGESFTVDGVSWTDHEYSTSALSQGAVGWDWFSLQLDDGSALMLFQIRRDDGSLQPESSGTFIYPDGRWRTLALGEWELEVLDHWQSPTSGADYPAGWRIAVPAIELSLEGVPLMANQELNVSTTYWEGAVAFEGSREERVVEAKGYIEMTGYAQ